jgi:hypothetical protein
MLGRSLLICLLCLSSYAWAYELTIIQGISRSGQTFLTRNGKKEGITEGKKVTFTADNVSIIAKAIKVTREFTQWEVENAFTDVPFRKGQVVTYYDTTEYLWTLTPEKIKQKYIKTQLYSPRKSISFNSALFRGVSESVSGVEDRSVTRGGIDLESYLEREYNLNMAFAFGLRYTIETINVNEASLSSNRFLGIAEARYYFDPMRNFYGVRLGLGLGVGYGQSRTDTDGLVSSGVARILPITKGMMVLPLSKQSEFLFETAFEALEVQETLADKTIQTTNVTNFKFGIAVKRYF